MYIHIADFTDDNVRMILPPIFGRSSTYRLYLYGYGLGNPDWHGV